MARQPRPRTGSGRQPPWAARRGVLGCWLRQTLGLAATLAGLAALGYAIAVSDPNASSLGPLAWLLAPFERKDVLDRLILTAAISAAALVLVVLAGGVVGPWLVGPETERTTPGRRGGAAASLTVAAALVTALPLALIIRFAAMIGWSGPEAGPLWFEADLLSQPWSLVKAADIAAGVWLPALIAAAAALLGELRRVGDTLTGLEQRPEVMLARVTPLTEGAITAECRPWLTWRAVLADSAALAPALISAVVAVSIVLDLPTLGPWLAAAALRQEMGTVGWTLAALGGLAAVAAAGLRMLLVLVDPVARASSETETAVA